MMRFLCLMLLLAIGCNGEDLSSKKTLFDHDHETPAHWPSGPGDAADKMETRLARLDGSEAETVQAELSDLVSWSAEVAADTALSEQQWVPIYESSETLQATLRADGWNESSRQQTEQLCQLLHSADEILRQQSNSSLDARPEP